MQQTIKCLLTVAALNDSHKAMTVSWLPSGPLQAEKIAELVLLYVFSIAFTASLCKSFLTPGPCPTPICLQCEPVSQQGPGDKWSQCRVKCKTWRSFVSLEHNIVLWPRISRLILCLEVCNTTHFGKVQLKFFSGGGRPGYPTDRQCLKTHNLAEARCKLFREILGKLLHKSYINGVHQLVSFTPGDLHVNGLILNPVQWIVWYFPYSYKSGITRRPFSVQEREKKFRIQETYTDSSTNTPPKKNQVRRKQVSNFMCHVSPVTFDLSCLAYFLKSTG